MFLVKKNWSWHALKFCIHFKKHLTSKESLLCDCLSRSKVNQFLQLAPWANRHQVKFNSTFAISELKGNIQKLLDASITNYFTTSYSLAWTVFRDLAEKLFSFQLSKIYSFGLLLHTCFPRTIQRQPKPLYLWVSAVNYIHKLNNLKDPSSSYLIQKFGAQPVSLNFLRI